MKHVRPALLVIAVSLLAGCATTPESIRERGSPERYQLRQPPKLAAPCVSQRASEYRHFFIGQVLNYPDSQEVRVRMEAIDLMALAELRAAGEGSTMDVWLSWRLPDSLKNLGQRMADRC